MGRLQISLAIATKSKLRHYPSRRILDFAKEGVIEAVRKKRDRCICPAKAQEKEQTMAEKDPKVVGQESSQTLTDEQIVTERKMPRRSFLTAAGALLVGAAALASGVRAVAQQGSDPDSKKAADPDSKDKKKTTKAKTTKAKAARKASKVVKATPSPRKPSTKKAA